MRTSDYRAIVKSVAISTFRESIASETVLNNAIKQFIKQDLDMHLDYLLDTSEVEQLRSVYSSADTQKLGLSFETFTCASIITTCALQYSELRHTLNDIISNPTYADGSLDTIRLVVQRKVLSFYITLVRFIFSICLQVENLDISFDSAISFMRSHYSLSSKIETLSTRVFRATYVLI